MKKDRQLVILLAALLVLIFLSSCAAGNNASMTPAATDFAYLEKSLKLPFPTGGRNSCAAHRTCSSVLPLLCLCWYCCSFSRQPSSSASGSG